MERRLLVATDADFPDFTKRIHKSDEPSARTDAERDRDRILYSSAFQRLGHVTQVTASETGLSFHSRLTHSLKVAQFARRLAERLRRDEEIEGLAASAVTILSPDAVEAAALAHDLGHPPFGHLAEQELDKLASGFGGFEGNAQSFRILTRLAHRAAEQEGLNLTRRTLNGVLKYPWARQAEDRERDSKWNYYGADEETFGEVRGSWKDLRERTLEAEIMDWADDVTYAVHDMDDFYRAGLVPLDRLGREKTEIHDFKRYLAEKVRRDASGDVSEDQIKTRVKAAQAAADQLFTGAGPIRFAAPAPYRGEALQRIGLRTLGSFLITRYIRAPKIEVKNDQVYFVIDEKIRREVYVLKQLIWYYIIERPSLAVLQNGQRHIIRTLYKTYETAALEGNLSIFPPLYRKLLDNKSANDKAKCRVVVDLIAGMTEARAVEIYRRMLGVSAGSIGDATARLT